MTWHIVFYCDESFTIDMPNYWVSMITMASIRIRMNKWSILLVCLFLPAFPNYLHSFYRWWRTKKVSFIHWNFLNSNCFHFKRKIEIDDKLIDFVFWIEPQNSTEFVNNSLLLCQLFSQHLCQRTLKFSHRYINSPFHDGTEYIWLKKKKKWECRCIENDKFCFHLEYKMI